MHLMSISHDQIFIVLNVNKMPILEIKIAKQILCMEFRVVRKYKRDAQYHDSLRTVFIK